MITLIGTGHVFNLSQGILEILDEIQPDVIGVELDENRFKGLLLKKNDPEKFSQTQRNVPFIYKFLARFQDSMADEYGVIAGDICNVKVSSGRGHVGDSKGVAVVAAGSGLCNVDLGTG